MTNSNGELLQLTVKKMVVLNRECFAALVKMNDGKHQI